MILGGDELGHTQQGNNNGYCQDNELTWLNWELSEESLEFLDFVKSVTRIWNEQPVLQRRTFFQGRSIRGDGVQDVTWFNCRGDDMSDEDWQGFVRCIGLRLAGDLIDESDSRGENILGDTLLMLMNAHHEPIPFTLPVASADHRWEMLFDTAPGQSPDGPLKPREEYLLQPRSMAVFRTVSPGEARVSPLQVELIRQETQRRGPPLTDVAQ